MNDPRKRWTPLGFFLSLSLLTLGGCAALKQFAEMNSFSKCQFRLASVEGTTLADVPIQGIKKISDINLMDMVKLRGVFSGGALPVHFILNLEVKNPNSSSAGMNKFQWLLYMDDTHLTSGLLEKRVEIGPNGAVGNVPLAVTLDLRKVLSGKTLDSMMNLALNIAGEGTKPTRLTIKIKPSILVAGQELEYPDYVTVSHEFTAEESKGVRDGVLKNVNF
jgi:hypothetical protein